VEKPTQALQLVKGAGNTFDFNPKWTQTLPSLTYVLWSIYRDSPSFQISPTQALRSVKDAGNIFDKNHNWTKDLPPLIYCSGDIYREPPPQKKFQISKLIFDTLLWVSTLIFDFSFVEGVLYKYPMNNIKVGKVLIHLGLKSKVLSVPFN
jgi:hypothetical protein